MAYRIPDDLIAKENAKLAPCAGRGLRRPRPAARARRRRHRRDNRQGRRLRRRRSDLGRRHGRHALRPLSRPGRAARRLRQARGLRDDPSAHPRDADLLAPLPVGQGQRLSRARRAGEGARRRLRRRQLEHLPGPARPEALLQVRLADPQRQGGARSGGGAQPRMHRDRREARVEGADGLDRRRLELPGPVEPEPRLRLVSRVAERDLPRVCRPTGGCSSSTSSTSRPSIRRSFRTGARA